MFWQQFLCRFHFQVKVRHPENLVVLFFFTIVLAKWDIIIPLRLHWYHISCVEQDIQEFHQPENAVLVFKEEVPLKIKPMCLKWFDGRLKEIWPVCHDMVCVLSNCQRVKSATQTHKIMDFKHFLIWSLLYWAVTNCLLYSFIGNGKLLSTVYFQVFLKLTIPTISECIGIFL